VRCVETHMKHMRFVGHARIHQCFPFLFEQLEILRPKVIVLQGRGIHGDFKKELTDGGWGTLEMTENEILGKITWHRYGEYRGPVIVAFFLHPSALGRHMFTKEWDSENLPAIQVMQSLL
jgi:uracil-DNA glycosylase